MLRSPRPAEDFRPAATMPQAPGWLAQPEAKVRELTGSRQLADETWAPVAQGHPGAANRFDQRAAVPQFKQPSSTSTVSLSTASLSTSTMKSEAKHEQSFSPQPTARKSLFCTFVVLSITSIRTRWDLISTNVVSILIEEGVCHGCLDSIRFDYDYEHRPPRRTEHEHDEIR